MRIFLAALVLSLVPALKASPWPPKSLFHLGSQWTDQDGESLNIQDLAGSPRIAVMLYTRCTTTCPLVVEDIKEVLKELPKKQANKMKVTIFSIDAERETPVTMKDFVKKRKLDSRWQLLTATPEDVSTLAAALGVRYKKVEDEFVHSNVMFLWDEKGQVLARKEGLRTPKADFVSEMKTLLGAP